MSQPVSPFDDPEVIHLGVPEMRQYWAHLLRNCIDKYAQEHPLYALFSSILSTLAKVTCAADSNASPTTAGGTFIFSYPQCRVVNKTMVGGDEYAPMSVYPDFGLLRSTMTQLSNGDIVQLEQIKLLVEVKRLYRGDEANGWFWANRTSAYLTLEMSVSSNFRQLLLQAYCAFEAYEDNEVYVMLITGIYFTLFKFSRPGDFESLRLEPDPQPKRQKFKTGSSGAGQPKWRAAKSISDSRLASLIPLECVNVLYPNAPVFVDAQDWDLRLSDAFRLALNSQLNEVRFQPCSLFDLQGAQYTPSPEDSGIAEKKISNWYTAAKSEGTPKGIRPDGLYYYESPTGAKDSPETPGYRGRAIGVGVRESLPREAKDVPILDFFASTGRRQGDGGPIIEESSGVGTMGGDLQEGFWGEGGIEKTESAGEGQRRKGKRRADDM